MFGQRVGHLLDAIPAGLLLGDVVVFLFQERTVAGCLQERAECGGGVGGSFGRPQGDQALKRRHAAAGGWGERAGIASQPQLSPQAVAGGGAGGPGGENGLRGEAAGRHVGHPREGQIIVGIDEHPQEGHRIFHFAAVEERSAPHDFIGNAAAPQFLLEHARLIACAHENHRLARQHLPFAHPALHIPHDASRFVDLVLGLHDHRRGARTGGGKESLPMAARIAGDEQIGRMDDLGS